MESHFYERVAPHLPSAAACHVAQCLGVHSTLDSEDGSCGGGMQLVMRNLRERFPRRWGSAGGACKLAGAPVCWPGAAANLHAGPAWLLADGHAPAPPAGPAAWMRRMPRRRCAGWLPSMPPAGAQMRRGWGSGSRAATGTWRRGKEGDEIGCADWGVAAPAPFDVVARCLACSNRRCRCATDAASPFLLLLSCAGWRS